MTRPPSKQLQAILDLIKSEPGLTTKEIAWRLNTSRSVIAMGMWKLRTDQGVKFSRGYRIESEAQP